MSAREIEVGDEEETNFDPQQEQDSDRIEYDPSFKGEEKIDRRPGSGSLSREEAWASESAHSRSFLNDGRSKTRTTFYYTSDSDDPLRLRDRDRHQKNREPDKKRTWSQLAQLNDGKYNSHRSIENNEADVSRWIDIFSGQLYLNDLQRDRVEYIIDDIDMGMISGYGISIEVIILGVISLVVDSEIDENEIENWTVDDWIVYDDKFQSLMDSVGCDMGDIWTARKLVTEESEYAF